VRSPRTNLKKGQRPFNNKFYDLHTTVNPENEKRIYSDAFYNAARSKKSAYSGAPTLLASAIAFLCVFLHNVFLATTPLLNVIFVSYSVAY
jgi:hypothetical protein